MADKWCSGAADKWLQVDLGAAYALSTVVIRHAGAGDEPGSWNTRDFAIEVSTNGTTWTTAVNVTGNTADVTTHPVTGTFRYVRLRVITATSTSDVGRPHLRTRSQRHIVSAQPRPLVWLGRFIHRWRWPVIAVWTVVLAVGAVFGGGLFDRLSVVDSLSPGRGVGGRATPHRRP